MKNFLGKLYQISKKIPSEISIEQIWWIPAIVPLCIALSALIAGVWSWGLMDDYHYAFTTGTIFQKFIADFNRLFPAGRFYPVFNLHSSIFYTLFKDSPKSFFIFRWVEVIATLGCWGYLSILFTKKKVAAPLFIAITLSFYKFYDAFFYLSTQEILGCFFAGVSFLLFYFALNQVYEKKENIKWAQFVGAVILLLLAFMSKEPFVTVGIAVGVCIFLLGFTKGRLKSFLWIGGAIFWGSIMYALMLKIFVVREYSAQYSLTDFDKVFLNLKFWAGTALIEHLPWIIVAVIVALFSGKTFFKMEAFIPKLLGFLLYLFYFGLIIPWSGGGHYVVPLAIFFAFFITMVLVDSLLKIPKIFLFFIVTASLLFNICVGGRAISAHEKYQYDTYNMQQWMVQNALFRHEVLMQGKTVRSNANEPAGAIPALINKKYGISFKLFIYTPFVRDIVVDPQTKYFVWGVHWGDQDLRRLGGDRWNPMFVSDNWIVFRRMN